MFVPEVLAPMFSLSPHPAYQPVLNGRCLLFILYTAVCIFLPQTPGLSHPSPFPFGPYCLFKYSSVYIFTPVSWFILSQPLPLW